MGWQDAPVVSAGASWQSAPEVGAAPAGRSWSDVPGEALSNIIPSAERLYSGIKEAVTSPVQTATSLGKLAGGVIYKAMPKPVQLLFNAVSLVPPQQLVEAANAAGQFYADRYGSEAAIKKTLAEDPVGAAADLSMLLTGTGGALAKAGLPGAAKAANVAGTVLNAPVSLPIAAAGKAVSAGASAAGVAADIAAKNIPKLRAAKIVQELAGPDTAAVQAAARAATPDLTAGQAIYGATERPGIQALASEMSREFSERFYPREQAQIRARPAALEAVRPDLAALEAARDETAALTYGRAFAADQQRLDELRRAREFASGEGAATGYAPPPAVSPAMQALATNPAIQAATKEAKVLAATKGVQLTDPLSTLEGAHYVKLAIDNQFKNPTAPTALQNYSKQALVDTKNQLLTAIDEFAPQYGVARNVYAQMSPEIDQAKLLNEMLAVLAKEGGGERVTPFLNALGRGESALLKRSTGFPRYEGIEDVLTGPGQMAAVEKVAGEMARDTGMAQAATAGMRSLQKVLEKHWIDLESPHMLSTKVTIFNRVMKRVSKRLNEKTLNELGRAFESGANLDELLKVVPSKQRSEVLQAFSGEMGRVSPIKVTALGQTTNALSSQESNNALAR